MKQYTITVNGNTYNVTVQEGAGGVPAASAVPAAAPVQAAPAAPAAAPAAPAASGSVKIECPMSGKILAIKANVGQAVKQGDPIMVLEAMKMENEIVATQDGTIASIDCAVGQSVESGATLATLN